MNSIEAVYVLSVKSFKDRVEHVSAQMRVQNIKFEFIFEHDVPSLSPADTQVFSIEESIGLPQQSLVLKHIAAWKRCVDEGRRLVMIFEDDVVLHKDFSALIETSVAAAMKHNMGFLIFLGGADTRVPREYFLCREPIFKNAIATADGYVTDREACLKRLAWLEANKVSLPADHLIKQIDHECGITQYWTTTPLVEQGSVFGLFTSSLDRGRLRHSNFYNLMRYRWKIFSRRTVPGFCVRLYASIIGKY